MAITRDDENQGGIANAGTPQNVGKVAAENFLNQNVVSSQDFEDIIAEEKRAAEEQKSAIQSAFGRQRESRIVLGEAEKGGAKALVFRGAGGGGEIGTVEASYLNSVAQAIEKDIANYTKMEEEAIATANTESRRTINAARMKAIELGIQVRTAQAQLGLQLSGQQIQERQFGKTLSLEQAKFMELSRQFEQEFGLKKDEANRLARQWSEEFAQRKFEFGTEVELKKAELSFMADKFQKEFNFNESQAQRAAEQWQKSYEFETKKFEITEARQTAEFDATFSLQRDQFISENDYKKAQLNLANKEFALSEKTYGLNQAIKIADSKGVELDFDEMGNPIVTNVKTFERQSKEFSLEQAELKAPLEIQKLQADIAHTLALAKKQAPEDVEPGQALKDIVDDLASLKGTAGFNDAIYNAYVNGFIKKYGGDAASVGSAINQMLAAKEQGLTAEQMAEIQKNIQNAQSGTDTGIVNPFREITGGLITGLGKLFEGFKVITK